MFGIMDITKPKYVNVKAAAFELGVPAAWLRREADAGRIPCLRAGRKRLFNPKAVLNVLAERAVQPQPKTTQERTHL